MAAFKFISIVLILGLHHNVFAAEFCGVVFGSKVTKQQIEQARQAELLPATLEIDIRNTDGVERYALLDNPNFVGRKVLVKFFDVLRGGPNVTPYLVEQMILTRDYLDQTAQQAIDKIKAESRTANNGFIEVGIWVIHTKNGSYTSQTMTSGRSSDVSDQIVRDVFDEFTAQIRQTEGLAPKASLQATDIEFFHTHLERGEAFSPGDLDSQRHKSFLMKKQLLPDGTYSSHAIPVQGEVLFRSVLLDEN